MPFKEKPVPPEGEKSSIRFLERHDVKDHNGKIIESFVPGAPRMKKSYYEVPARSAYRFVELLGKAVYEEDDLQVAALADQVAGDAAETKAGEGVAGGEQKSEKTGGDADANDRSTDDGDDAGAKPGADNRGSRKGAGNVARRR